MISPRTPRQWNAGDTIPDDVERVRDVHGRIWSQQWLRMNDGSKQWRLPGSRFGSSTESVTGAFGPVSEVLPETPEPPREDRPRSDAPTLWRRLQVAARVIKAFKPEDPSPELIAFLRDIRDAVDGDLLEDELSGDLMRFARGQGRLLTALLAAQGAEIAEDATDDHSAERGQRPADHRDPRGAALPSGVDPIRLALERRMAAYLESELGAGATFEAKVDELLNSYGALLRKIDGQATS